MDREAVEEEDAHDEEDVEEAEGADLGNDYVDRLIEQNRQTCLKQV